MARTRSVLVPVLAVLATLAASAAPARAQVIEVGMVQECVEAVPASIAIPAPEPLLEVHLHVVLDDGVTLEEGRQAIEKANLAYQPIGMKINANFTTASTRTDNVDDLMADLKMLFGGVRPPWAHAVYLLTKRDMTAPNVGSGVAGKADCIGGVAFPDAAFAVGEVIDDASGIFGVTLMPNLTAKILGHEVGHLFGAHHHYANCTEATPSTDDAGPCTLMFNDIALEQIRFSMLNGGVVRGHGISYLEPITAEPPPDGSRSIAPAAKPLTTCDLRSYTDSAGDQTTRYVGEKVEDGDLVGGTFHIDERTGGLSFRWKVANLDGDFGDTVADVRYRLYIETPRALQIFVQWDGTNPPMARAMNAEGSTVADLQATITPGPGGVVEVALPLEELGLAGSNIGLAQINATTVSSQNLLAMHEDSADPTTRAINPAACIQQPPRIITTHDVDHPPVRPLAGAAKLRLELVGASARRAAKQGTLRVRVTGVARAATLRLTDARGRTVASGRAKKIDGAQVVTLRVARRIRAGAHTLHLSARGLDGKRLAQRVAVRVKR